MEFSSCEQYVLAELSRAERENELLRKRVEELEERCDLGPIGRKVVEQGRRVLFLLCTTASTTPVMRMGRVVPFGEWCLRCTMSHVIDFCGLSDFIEYFEPEFEKAYREASMLAGDAE